MRTMVPGDLWWAELKGKVEAVERRCAQIERAQRRQRNYGRQAQRRGA